MQIALLSLCLLQIFSDVFLAMQRKGLVRGKRVTRGREVILSMIEIRRCLDNSGQKFKHQIICEYVMSMIL